MLLLIIVWCCITRVVESTPNDCANDYCFNNGICQQTTAYLNLEASIGCPSGWINHENVCYRIIWNPLPHEVAKNECAKVFNATLAPLLTYMQLLLLAPKFQNLIKYSFEQRGSSTVLLWTAFCNDSGCSQLSNPLYSDTLHVDPKQLALPLCAFQPRELFNHTKQCKCPIGWGGHRCDDELISLQATQDEPCDNLSCPPGKQISIDYASYGTYPDERVCKELLHGRRTCDKMCNAPNSLAAVKYWCEGKRSCSRHAEHSFNGILNISCTSSEICSETLIIIKSCKRDVTHCPLIDGKQSFLVNGSHCWHLLEGTLTWRQAADECSVLGGRLAFLPPDLKPNLIPSEILYGLRSAITYKFWIRPENLRNDLSEPKYFTGPVLPFVCSYYGDCHSPGKMFKDACYEMIHELKYLGEAEAYCRNVKLGHIAVNTSNNYQFLVDFTTENMTETGKFMDFWIAGTSNDSRDEIKTPNLCSMASVNVVGKIIIKPALHSCPLEMKARFAICALPPSPHESNVTCKERTIESHRGTTTWKAIGGGKNQIHKCINANGYVKWFCDPKTGEFYPSDEPDWSDCHVLPNNIREKIQDSTTADEKMKVVADELDKVENKSLTGSDVNDMLTLVNEIKAQHNQNISQLEDKFSSTLNFTEQATNVIDKLMSDQNSLAYSDLPNATVSTKLLNTIDSVGFTFANTVVNGTFNIPKPKFVLRVESRHPQFYEKKLLGTSFPGVSILVPKEVINNYTAESLKSIYVLYNNMSILLSTNHSTENKFTQYQLNSHVIGASFGSENTSFTFNNSFVLVTFQHLVEVSPGSSTTCTFWNISINKWDTKGCSKHTSNKTHTICQCNHLTNLALLTDIHDNIRTRPRSAHDEILTWITIVGCSTSIVCLVTTCVVFIAIRPSRSLRTVLLCNLCVCLAIAHAFVFGLKSIENKMSCSIRAGLAHYSWLAVFTWFGLEGIHFYSKFVKILGEEHKARYYYLAGYGLPALIVGISAAIKPTGYGTKNTCWLSPDDGFIYSFVAPMLFVILFNCIIMVFVTKTIASATSQRNEDMVQKTRKWLWRCAYFIPLLGLTWIFGVLSKDGNTIIFSYFHTILNSSQGVFIFIYHCLLDKSIFEAVTKWFQELQKEQSTSATFYTKVDLSSTATTSECLSPTSPTATTSECLSPTSPTGSSVLEHTKNRRFQY